MCLVVGFMLHCNCAHSIVITQTIIVLHLRTDNYNYLHVHTDLLRVIHIFIYYNV